MKTPRLEKLQRTRYGSAEMRRGARPPLCHRGLPINAATRSQSVSARKFHRLPAPRSSCAAKIVTKHPCRKERRLLIIHPTGKPIGASGGDDGRQGRVSGLGRAKSLSVRDIGGGRGVLRHQI